MSVEILEGKLGTAAILFCNTSDWAFGPVFDGMEQAEDFLRWLREREPTDDDPPANRGTWDRRDPRCYEAGELEQMHLRWREERLDDDGELRQPAEAAR